MDLYELALKLTTEGEAEMRAALATIAEHGQHTAESLGGIEHAFHNMLGPLVELIAVWEGAEIFKHMIEEAAELAVKLERTSQMTGITAERLAELGEAAELSYVPVDQLNIAFRRLSISLTDAHSKGAQAMAAMGLDIKSFHGDADKALTAIAEKFASFKDDANKSALAIEIFGRGGLAMIPLLNNLAETTEKVKELGQTMTNEQKTTMLEYEQAMIRLKITSDGFSRQIATETAPAIATLADAFTIAIREGERVNVVAELIAGTMRFLATVILVVKLAFEIAADVVVAFANTAIAAFGTVGKLWTDFWHMDKDALKKDATEGLAGIREAWHSTADMMLEDAKRTDEAIAKLYGFGDADEAKAKKKGTKKAPVIAGKEEKDDSFKYFLKRLQDEQAATKAKYEYDVEAAKDNYEKISALDAAYLATVIDLYDEGSKEYYEALKEQERHKQEHDKAILAMQKRLKKDMDTLDDEALAREAERHKKAEELSRVSASIIEATFKAGFSKGGTIGSAMKAFGDTILQGLGGIFVRLGEQYMSYGAIMDALAALLPDPFTAGPASLAIGAALIALGSSLGAIGSGGGGGGGGASSAYTGAPPAYPTQIIFGPSSATTAAGMTPTAPMNVTVIGPNDPTAQRQITELITKAQRRGG